MIKKVNKIPDVIQHSQFLKFVEYYANLFKEKKGFGRWLKEYQDMDAKGLFAPRVLRLFYIQILSNTFKLDFQREQAVWYICCYAKDATEKYIEERENALYNICVVTGEIAVDDDDDEYTELEYDEAIEICKALNDEAEEELFFVKRM